MFLSDEFQWKKDADNALAMAACFHHGIAEVARIERNAKCGAALIPDFA
jgi:hypothetical protein